MSTEAKEKVPANQFKPRRYQLELLEYVTERNAIIYLPTGAGKTYVAILALKRYSHEFQETINNGGKRAIFMCNTVELARQQAVCLKSLTNLKIGFYVGERDVDNWSPKKWNEEIQENQVLVGTAQIFLDIVTQNYLKITDLSIVIIDECHHATKAHPMHEFMRLFTYSDQSKLPRVIGLTGVLLKGNKLNNIHQELLNLEATFRGNIVTVSSMEQFENVMVYSTKPKEQIVTYSQSDKYTFELEHTIKKILISLFKTIDEWDIGNIALKLSKGLSSLREPSKKNYIKNLLRDFEYQMDDFGLYAAAIAIMSPIIEFEIKKRQAETIALRDLYRNVICKCENIRHILINKLKDMTDSDSTKDSECHKTDIILNYATPKLRSLLSYIESVFVGKDPKDVCCLIFVERRYSAKCLYYVLQKFVDDTPKLAQIIRPQFMVGRNSIAPGIESILDRKWNKSAIEKFRTGECNVIICSNVLEEGIDIQACNYVFAFDQLKTFNSYVQTKGRARSNESIYTIFSSDIDEIATIQKVGKYQKIHTMIREFLMGRLLDRDDPKEEDITEQFTGTIEPYCIPSGARLLPSCALNTLHRYCQLLPSDAFGSVTPWFTKVKQDDKKGVRVSLRLPLQSIVKDVIYSDYMENVKSAKMSAAFNACIRLYEEGELNEKLLPVTKRECVAKVAEELFKHWNEHNDDVTKGAAGKQKRRLYDRQSPDEFYNAMPVVGETCYAYAIKYVPNFEENEYNSHYITNLNTSNTYGILLRKRLPRLAEMPFFMNQGSIKVKISEEPIECCIRNEEELEQLRKYHTMIFRDLLQLWKSFFVMDKRNKENSYLIVPLKPNAEDGIDYSLVESFQRLPPFRKYSVAERSKKVYRPEDYLGKVITKCYSEFGNERYIVTKVNTNITPLSDFPNQEFENYAHFVESKYSEQIDHVVQRNQFMIEVRELTSRRNFFINAAGKKRSVYRKLAPVSLIPELCHNYMYPGDMWLKALFLPSILHRVYYMLHADALRREVNTFLGVDQNEAAYRPKPLIVDTSLLRVVDSDGNAVEEQEEPKKLLSALPPKQTKPHFQVRSLVTDEATWKDYLEPEDFSRKTNSVYSIEIDYYHKFINGLAAELDNLKLEEAEEWTNTQFNMPSITGKMRTAQPSGTSSRVANISTLSIGEAPLADRQRIEILERSLGNSAITTAEQYEFLAALTSAGANDVFDMERYELLGDSFLKFSASLYLANKYPKWHEGFLTVIKSRLVSNRNLLYCMFKLDIRNRICSSLFRPNHEWLPPLCSLPSNLLELLGQNLPLLSNISPRNLYDMELSEDDILEGNCNPNQLESFVRSCASSKQLVDGDIELKVDNDINIFIYKEVMPDKVVADTLEAILGVCVKNYGIHKAFRMMEFFNICKPEPDRLLSNLLDLNLGSPLLRTNISVKEIDGFLINHEKLEENLKYKFRDRAYLLQALTHPSFPTNRLTGCYQQLEFIGDAILDFLVSCYIFERNKNMTPGMLTDLRSALVNNITLGCVCVRHRFHLFLLAENSVLADSIKAFADFQETQNHRVTDQVRILMEEDMLTDEREGIPYNLSVNVDVPKTLGDIVEALIAAVYLDCRDIKTTWNVIHHLLEQELNEFAHHVPIDPVRQLYEHKSADPKFSDTIVDNEVVMVKCTFMCLDKRIEVNGFGLNSKQARKSASKHALQILAKHSS